MLFLDVRWVEVWFQVVVDEYRLRNASAAPSQLGRYLHFSTHSSLSNDICRNQPPTCNQVAFWPPNVLIFRLSVLICGALFSPTLPLLDRTAFRIRSRVVCDPTTHWLRNDPSQISDMG